MQTRLPSVRSEAVERRTYRRPLNPEGSAFESRSAMIQRMVTHTARLWQDAGGSPSTTELAELHSLFDANACSLSGRTRNQGGTDFAFSRPSTQINCAALTLSSVYDFVDDFWLLLLGSGVGVLPKPGVLRGFNRPLSLRVTRSVRRPSEKGRPSNLETFDPTTGEWTLQIGDSAEAWAKAIGKLLLHPFNADCLHLDLSQIRGPGLRLRDTGWICTGDAPLAAHLPPLVTLLNSKAGGHLLDDHDLLDVSCHLGAMLSTRRAAKIGFMHAHNPRLSGFMSFKDNCWQDGLKHRQQSNNTVIYWSQPSVSSLLDHLQSMDSLGGGDPALLNGEAALRRAPWFCLTNPCLHGDTLVPLSGGGLRRIRSLASVRTPHAIKDGRGRVTPSVCRLTRRAATLMEATLSDGSRYLCTPDHRFALADGSLRPLVDIPVGSELRPATPHAEPFGPDHHPDLAYIDAWLIADGTRLTPANEACRLDLYPPKHFRREALERAGLTFREGIDPAGRITSHRISRPMPPKDRVPDYVLSGTEPTTVAFIRGYFESDGHISHTTQGWQAQIVSIHRAFLEDFQALLRLHGVYSAIGDGLPAGDRLLPDGKGGHRPYRCQRSYRLAVSNPARLFEVLGMEDRNVRGPYQKTRRVYLKSAVMTDRVEPVYCFNVLTTHSFDLPTVHSGNCGEILLPDKGFCNLVEVNLSAFGRDMGSLLRATYLMGRANYRQTCVDFRDGVLSPQWHQTNEALRLCGVGMTGIAQATHLTDYDLRALRDAAVTGAHSMADELGLPRSKAVTTIKPSGTLSKVMDCTEGIHRPIGRYIFNWIGYSIHDPLVPVLERSGYKVLAHPVDPAACLICFPVSWPTVPFDSVDGKPVNLESAISQLERYARWMRLYVDHNASCTISYSPSELPAIASWLHSHWNTGDFVAVSFAKRLDPTMTAASYGVNYLPQEVVDPSTFTSYESSLRPVDWSYSDTGVYDLLDAPDCSSGACPVR